MIQVIRINTARVAIIIAEIGSLKAIVLSFCVSILCII